MEEIQLPTQPVSLSLRFIVLSISYVKCGMPRIFANLEIKR